MEEIIKQVQQWSYYHSLPETIHGFCLNRDLRQQDSKLYMFEYSCPQMHRSLYAYYDKATKEFMVHTVVGLFDFCDITSISADLATFEATLKKSLVATIEAMAFFDKNRLCSVFCSKQIMEHNWQAILPEQESGFSLFISPQRPVKIVNGSYIIIDYCDFAAESNLTVYYNIYRDEFFSERRIRRLPEIVTDFEAKSLEALISRLTERLVPALNEMREILQNK